MSKVILLRHGITQYNIDKIFTGWTDVPLAPQGIEEAKHAGKLIKNSGIEIDEAYTSYLDRSKMTLKLALETMGRADMHTTFSWRLNERHYGALQGIRHADMAEKYSKEQVQIWRRSYDVRPPLLSPDDPRAPQNIEMYNDVPREDLPLGESLKDTIARVMPLWDNEIMPKIKEGKNILIVLSGNSGRAIIKKLDTISDDDIVGLNVPTGEPLVYEFDAEGKEIKHYYLSPNDVIQAKIDFLKK